MDDVPSHDHPHKGGPGGSNQRLCEQIAMGTRKGGGSIVHVSKEKLLEASLLSLETLGRQRHHPALEGSANHDSLNALEREREREREAQEAHPTEAYLRGDSPPMTTLHYTTLPISRPFFREHLYISSSPDVSALLPDLIPFQALCGWVAT